MGRLMQYTEEFGIGEGTDTLEKFKLAISSERDLQRYMLGALDAALADGKKADRSNSFLTAMSMAIMTVASAYKESLIDTEYAAALFKEIAFLALEYGHEMGTEDQQVSSLLGGIEFGDE